MPGGEDPPLLSNLVIRSGSGPIGLSNTTLSTPFQSTTFTYSITIPFEHTDIELDAFATTPIKSGHGINAPIPESLPADTITQFVITVIGSGLPGEEPRTDYTVNVYREPANLTAALSNLEVSDSTLSPGFTNLTFAYSASVPNDVTSVTVTPTEADPGSTITVNGDAVASGNPSPSIELPEGVTNVIVLVTSAEVTKAYTIDIRRFALDSDSDMIPDAYEDANGLTIGVDDSLLDLDGDGLCNLCEYAFGSDPNNHADKNPPVVTRDENGFQVISFNRAIPLVNGLSYKVEFSSDLTSWDLDAIDLTDSGSPETQIWRDNFGGAPSGPPARYVRIRFLSTL